MKSIEAVIDPASKKAEISDLEQQVAAPDLWDDQANAQRVTSRLSRLQADIERVETLHGRLEDVQLMLEMAAEEGDASAAEEAEAELGKLKADIEALEVRTLLLVI